MKNRLFNFAKKWLLTLILLLSSSSIVLPLLLGFNTLYTIIYIGFIVALVSIIALWKQSNMGTTPLYVVSLGFILGIATMISIQNTSLNYASIFTKGSWWFWLIIICIVLSATPFVYYFYSNVILVKIKGDKLIDLYNEASFITFDSEVTKNNDPWELIFETIELIKENVKNNTPLIKEFLSVVVAFISKFFFVSSFFVIGAGAFTAMITSANLHFSILNVQEMKKQTKEMKKQTFYMCEGNRLLYQQIPLLLAVEEIKRIKEIEKNHVRFVKWLQKKSNLMNICLVGLNANKAEEARYEDAIMFLGCMQGLYKNDPLMSENDFDEHLKNLGNIYNDSNRRYKKPYEELYRYRIRITNNIPAFIYSPYNENIDMFNSQFNSLWYRAYLNMTRTRLISANDEPDSQKRKSILVNEMRPFNKILTAYRAAKNNGYDKEKLSIVYILAHVNFQHYKEGRTDYNAEIVSYLDGFKTSNKYAASIAKFYSLHLDKTQKAIQNERDKYVTKELAKLQNRVCKK